MFVYQSYYQYDVNCEKLSAFIKVGAVTDVRAAGIPRLVIQGLYQEHSYVWIAMFP